MSAGRWVLCCAGGRCAGGRGAFQPVSVRVHLDRLRIHVRRAVVAAPKRSRRARRVATNGVLWRRALWFVHFLREAVAPHRARLVRAHTCVAFHLVCDQHRRVDTALADAHARAVEGFEASVTVIVSVFEKTYQNADVEINKVLDK